MGITDLEIVQLTTQLHAFVDTKTGYFRFKDFVDSAYQKWNIGINYCSFNFTARYS